MADGNLNSLKADKDYSETLNAELPRIDELFLSSSGQLSAAIERLLVLEKQTRQASDMPSTSRILVKILTFCKEAGAWGQLNEQLLLLSKKHGQLKQATTAMVQEVMKFLDDAPDLDTKIKTIDSLRTVTEGKIFAEVERARVTRLLCKIKESQGDIAGAAETLCELQVETYGSMERREKTDIILEQVALCIARGDFTQAGVLTRKISTKFLEEEDSSDLKLRFYELKIRLALEDENWLDCCKHYHAVYDTKSVLEDEARWKDVLANMVYFIVLAPYNNEQSDLLHRIASNDRLPLIPLHHELIKNFTKSELMRWPRMEEIYGTALRQTSVFAKEDAKSDKRWSELRKRVIQHVSPCPHALLTRRTLESLQSTIRASRRCGSPSCWICRRRKRKCTSRSWSRRARSMRASTGRRASSASRGGRMPTRC